MDGTQGPVKLQKNREIEEARRDIVDEMARYHDDLRRWYRRCFYEIRATQTLLVVTLFLSCAAVSMLIALMCGW